MSERTIQTSYYRGREVIKNNHASHADRAVLHCVDHLQHDHYNATHAEVYDSQTGVLHAVIKRTLTGITILFKRVTVIENGVAVVKEIVNV